MWASNKAQENIPKCKFSPRKPSNKKHYFNYKNTIRYCVIPPQQYEYRILRVYIIGVMALHKIKFYKKR